MTAQWIARPEAGGGAGPRLLALFARAVGRAPARLVLYPVALYFLLRRGPERRASREYLLRVLGRPATLARVFRHFLFFAQVTLDRVFLLQGGFSRFTIEVNGHEKLHEALALGRGALMLGAHFGSYEALRALSLKRPDVELCAVIDLGQNAGVSRLLNELNPKLAASVINARQPGAVVALAIKEALERGALVTLLADRARPGNRVIEADFLGGRAGFPAAPWELAVALKAPVLLSFGVYRGGNRYDLVFDLVTERVVKERDGGQPLAAWVQLLAGRLEAQARRAPYNWFNFYDFWT